MFPQGVSKELDKVKNKYQWRKKKMAETESQTSYFGTENLSVYDHPHSSVPKRMQGHFKKKTQQHKTKNKWTKINGHYIIHCYEL